MSKKQNNMFFISGRVIEVIMPTRYSEKFSKSGIVLEVFANGRRNEVLIDFINSNMGITLGINAGMWVNIDFMIGGKKHVNDSGIAKFYPSLEGISCTKED
jgi:hypothetical protein